MSVIKDHAVKEQRSLYIPQMKERFRLKRPESNKLHVKVRFAMRCVFWLMLLKKENNRNEVVCLNK
jgi:hypothetical protein